jgi:hypothetical protein
MHELAEQAREETLTPEEKEEVAAYERVGSLLSLLKRPDCACKTEALVDLYLIVAPLSRSL